MRILGLLAGAIYPGAQGGGILSTIILGIVGAFVGGNFLENSRMKIVAYYCLICC